MFGKRRGVVGWLGRGEIRGATWNMQLESVEVGEKACVYTGFTPRTTEAVWGGEPKGLELLEEQGGRSWPPRCVQPSLPPQ